MDEKFIQEVMAAFSEVCQEIGISEDEMLAIYASFRAHDCESDGGECD